MSYHWSADVISTSIKTNRAICPKLCGNCPFPQNFHTRKLGEITVFYALCTAKDIPNYGFSLTLMRVIWIRENPYSGIFYVVLFSFKISYPEMLLIQLKPIEKRRVKEVTLTVLNSLPFSFRSTNSNSFAI